MTLGVEWTRALMIGWIVIALVLSVIEVFWLKGGFSSAEVRNHVGPGQYRER